ncbi:ankyrin repeat domain-containing protein [Ramlibacter sp. H39-3-26]|uniref:ankyrin repeat domain-containing protein n=1 Tax=Curvibacter soli TaxID=3031331 RepID=UPI0023DAECAF|nr:ankyrin repeat domain-containing protein [Ramlibacter sp. H39-3-26]MDF1485692.1 ankyrin repeat domain-containing protein [Ramlibacter sp. H39-3-26]
MGNDSMRRRSLLGCFIAVVVPSASAGSYEDFFEAAIRNDGRTIARLLERGFDPNTLDPKGQTALIIAVREPSPDVIDALLQSPKTRVEQRNTKDESPLMIAAIKGNLALVKTLIARDADVNKPGWTPLHYAVTGNPPDQLAIMRVLLDSSAYIDAASPNGTTPLMMAAYYGSEDAVQLLLDEGADPRLKNQQGLTALDFASRSQRKSVVDRITVAIQRMQPNRGKW